MKRSSLRLVSAALIFAMALSFAACDKKDGGGTTPVNGGRPGRKIAEDSPWFNSVKTEITPAIDPSKNIQYANSSLAGADENNIVIFTRGDSMSTPGVIYVGYDAMNNSVATLTVVDRASKQVKNTIDLYKDFQDTVYIQSVSYSDGKANVLYTLFDERTGDPSYIEKIIDPSTGSVVDSRKISPSKNLFIENTFYTGPYRISIGSSGNEEQHYVLKIDGPDGQERTVDLKLEGKSVWDVNTIIPSGEGKVIVPAHTDGDARLILEVDLASGQFKELDAKEYEWLNLDNMESSRTGADGNLYYSTSVGIFKADYNNKTTQEVFNYSWCGESRAVLSDLQIGSCSGDSILLCGETYERTQFRNITQPPFVIVELTKADKNPHAGKTVLELYAPYGIVENKISEAIDQFNTTNGSYFIEFSSRYAGNERINYGNAGSQDESDLLALSGNANLSNKLAMDIMNGEGPDILMNVSGLAQLNNSNYLVDLAKYTGTFDKDKYFTNIIEGSKVDGALYQMPLCFGIEGIVTEAKYAGSSGVGFTTKEYEAFLKGPLNGTDAITSGQAIYFTKLFNGMSDKFIKDGKADFSGKEFAELADYVKNNVMEKPKTDNDNDNDDFFSDSPALYPAGYYATVNGIGVFLMNMIDADSDQTILGIPSTDGRGPMFSVKNSVAVSAQATNVEACVEFVKLLMTDEVMYSLSLSDDFVISRAAFRKSAEETVAYYNDDNRSNTSTPISGPVYGHFSDKNIDNMEKIISNAAKIDSEDAAISIILYEEMPAYFLGQKDLASVVKIAQDRAQKVLSERA